MGKPGPGVLSPVVSLRPVIPKDLDRFFAFQQDPDANHMAAFTVRDPSDRAAFDAHWQQRLARESIINRTVLLDASDVVGSISKFDLFDQPEVTYWIDSRHWGRGIAGRALQLFLNRVIPDLRPVYARAAHDNRASIRVLEKCGFVQIGTDRGYASARREVIDELVFRLD